ncbi:hypothetical protein P9112_005853 [Eukaryota sp. TZLM1-RC]
MFNSGIEVATLCLLTHFYTLQEIQDVLEISTATLKRRFLKYKHTIPEFNVKKPPKGPKSFGKIIPLTRDIYSLAFKYTQANHVDDFILLMTDLYVGDVKARDGLKKMQEMIDKIHPPSVPVVRPEPVRPFTNQSIQSVVPFEYRFTPGGRDDWNSSEMDDLFVVNMLCHMNEFG